MGIGGSSSCPETPEEKLEIERFLRGLRQDTRTSSYFYKPELPNPDDTTHNQNWWKEYCKDNNLDINTGKRLR